MSEFDQKKRSCRRRLSDHNARRRKPQPDTFSFGSARLSSPFYGTSNSSLTNVGFLYVPIVFHYFVSILGDWAGHLVLHPNELRDYLFFFVCVLGGGDRIEGGGAGGHIFNEID